MWQSNLLGSTRMKLRVTDYDMNRDMEDEH